jgi:RraA family protein
MEQEDTMDRTSNQAPTLKERTRIVRVAAEIAHRAAAFPAAVLADVANRRNALHGRISPLLPTMRMAGPAVTVEVKPGDNLAIHAAIALCQPGDVLVVDGKGDLSCSLMGAIMTNTCVARRLAGVVVDGAIRDVEELHELNFPVFAAGANPNGPTKITAGRINEPVSVGGRMVHPGDLMVGDADGVVVIERDTAESLLELAARKVEAENAIIARLRAGTDLVPAWLEDALRQAGMLAKDESL